MLIALLIPLVLASLLFTIVLIRSAVDKRAKPNAEAMGLGAVVAFFDTLGIGSFAPTAAWFKFRNLVPDRLIPPTMLVGLTPPVMVESVIFLVKLGVKVDGVLLFGSAVALLLGGLLGAPLVARTRVWVVQLTVAVGLLLAAVAYTMNNLNLMPGGGTASALPPVLTMIAIAASFGFGILLNFGVGNYAPTLVFLSLMGMDPRLCFPVMAGGAALMGAGAGARHIQMGNDRPARRARPRYRRHTRRAGRRLHRGDHAAGTSALARHRGRALRRRSHAAGGDKGQARAHGRTRHGRDPRMTDVEALNRDFTKYDQVRKAHTYRLAEHESDEFDEDYEIATLDFDRFLRGDAGDKERFAEAFTGALEEIGFAVLTTTASTRRSTTTCTTRRSTCSPRHRSRRRCAFAPRGTGRSARDISRSSRPATSIRTWSKGWVWCRRAFEVPERREDTPFRAEDYWPQRGKNAQFRRLVLAHEQ